MAPTSLRALAALVGVVGIVFLAGSDPSRPVAAMPDDLEDMFIPRASWLAESIRAGRFPAWNPEVGCGIDQYATLQGAVWYPPMWLHAVLPLPASLGLLAYGHLLLAAGGLYCWLRGLNIGRPAALLSGAALAFGAVGESRWPTMLYSLAWIPWQFCILDRPGQLTLRRWLALVLVFALQIATGYPQFIAYGAIALFTYAVTKSFAEQSPRIALAVPSAALLGGLLLSVQLWPTLQYMRHESWRQSAVSPAEAHYLDVDANRNKPIMEQWARILPKSIENSSKDRQLSNRFSYGYLGALMPIAAFAALIWRRDWRVVFFALLAFAGLFLAGGYGRGSEPMYALFVKLPVLGGFRVPDRLLLWYLIGCCFLLGIGINWLLQYAPTRKGAFLLLALIVGLVVCRIGLALILESAVINVVVWASAMVLLAAVQFRSTRPADSPVPRRTVLALILICLVDLWLASAYKCPYFNFPTTWFDRIHTRDQVLLRGDELKNLADRAGHERIYIAGPYRQVMRTSYLPGYRTLPMYESLMPTRHYQLSNAVFPAEQAGYRHFTFWDIPPVPHQRVFDWCSIRYWRSPFELKDAESNGWIRVADWVDESRGVLYENNRCIPRASLHDRVIVESSETTLSRMVQPAEDDEQNLICLDSPPSRLPANSPSATANPGVVRWVLDEPGHLKLEVTADRPAMLLITESYSPGWSATIDGTTSTIFRANFLHQAVELSAGKHFVELHFATPDLRAGIGLSFMGLAIFAAFAVYAGGFSTASNATRAIDR